MTIRRMKGRSPENPSAPRHRRGGRTVSEELPPTAALGDNRARDREAHLGVGVEHQLARLDQVVQVAGGRREVWNRLRVFLDLDVLLGHRCATAAS